MPIRVDCSCGKVLKVTDAYAGKSGRCPGCGASFVVPMPAASQTPSLPHASKSRPYLWLIAGVSLALCLGILVYFLFFSSGETGSDDRDTPFVKKDGADKEHVSPKDREEAHTEDKTKVDRADRKDPLPITPRIDDKALALRALIERAVKGEDVLEALEKNHPRLFRPIQTLLVDRDSERHRAALAELAKLGPGAAGTAPLILHSLQTATRFEPFYAQRLMVSGIDALARVAPDDPSALSRLMDLTDFPDPPKGTFEDVRIAAVSALGEIARVYPPSRPRVTKFLTPLLENPKLQQAAIVAIGHCGSAAEPAQSALKNLKLRHAEQKVRDAAAESLARVDRALRLEPILAAVGIHENEVTQESFAQMVDLLDGASHRDASDTRKRTESFFAKLADAPRDGVKYRILRGLAQVGKVGEMDRGDVRTSALILLQPWVAADPALRADLLPVLTAGLSYPESGMAARITLLCCGADAVAHLKKAGLKIPDLAEDLKKLLNQANPFIAQAAVEGYGALQPRERDALLPLLKLLDESQPLEIRRAAARSLLHLTDDEGFLPTGTRGSILALELFDAAKDAKDPEVLKTMQQVFKNLGLEFGATPRFYSSLLLHNRSYLDLHATIEGRLGKGRDLETFAREADPKAMELLCRNLIEYYEDWFLPSRNYNSTARMAFDRFYRYPEVFGPHAKIMAPLFVEQLIRHGNGGKNWLIYPGGAIDALKAIGPVPGLDYRKALELNLTRRKGMVAWDESVGRKAKALLESLPAE